MRKKAELLNVSAPYLSDIEKSRRNPSEMDKLEQISSIPRLNEQERAFMFDLAGKMRNTVAPDLPNYITLKLVMRQRVDNYPHYAYLPMLDLFLPPG